MRTSDRNSTLPARSPLEPAGPAPAREDRGERLSLLLLATLVLAGIVLTPSVSPAHPLGNFSISQYTRIRIRPDVVELRYLIDMAEIPTYQEIQDTRIVPEPGHASLKGYLARKAESLKAGLVLQVDGRRLELRVESSEVIFPPGAGGLPTMKLGLAYRAPLATPAAAGASHLRYRDGNFPGRAGWKEIIAVAEPGVTLASSSAPEVDRSQELSDYPTDLLNSPPQDLEARIAFVRHTAPQVLAGVPSGSSSSTPAASRPAALAATEGPLATGSRTEAPPGPPGAAPAAGGTASGAPQAEKMPRLQANKQGTPRDAFTDLMTRNELGFGFVVITLVVAAGLGAAHALEPGHGKTVVAAYLVGSRGTAWHACLLGLIVTMSHTAGVFLLGALTLYASRYVVPERLYPWLGVVSGLAIAVLGFSLFLRRYAGHAPGHSHGHSRDHGHHHHHQGHGSHAPDYDRAHGHHHPQPGEAVSFSALLALGITGGMVPCPAALVVLLTALSLNRVGFGLILIVAFSVGLAAVLIAIGILMVYAGRFMARFQAEGPLIQRWLPLTSSAVVTILGLAIAVQALMAAGIIQIRL